LKYDVFKGNIVLLHLTTEAKWLTGESFANAGGKRKLVIFLCLNRTAQFTYGVWNLSS